MDIQHSAPGVTTSLDGDDLVIRIERDQASPLISILLHSKFSDGPRMEFLTNPYVNMLLEALMVTNDTTEYMAKREGMAEALASTIEFVEAWAERNGMSDEAADIVRSAIYPYSLT
ncbi:hypothetical protein DM806_02120 [Sphingobium lactosutens]|uniref:hypothetical protein n=1 Tax=Sphingobium lactosutens TaxID=522773 RepID=UPI0015BC9E34|nr:hypothetical protein [Sphingobium lactosutens]NWK94492.1 hypothetical protein [Sphingobium lactosutens]